MWMDAYVQQVLIRQQIAESTRAATLRHLVREAETSRAGRPWWPSVQRSVRAAVTRWARRPAARVAVR